MRVLNQYLQDFDVSTDIVEMLQPVPEGTTPATFAKLDRNAAISFRHPASFTQMHVLTTFIAQILFGSQQARSVEAQGEDDADKADDINALLAWNDTKIRLYTQGWLWIWNAIVYNRGVWYERADQDTTVEREPIEEDDISKPKVPLMRKDGRGPVMRGGKPVMVFQKRQRMKNKRVRSGFFNNVDLISPYDFICDPSLPWTRFQELRYMGHRVMIPWPELKRRSELEPEDDDYVLPHIVWKVKNARQNAIVPASLGGTPGMNSSRTYWNRTYAQGGITSIGIGGNGVGSGAGTDGVDKDDGGTIECFNLVIRAKPSTLEMYDDNEFEHIELLVTAGGDILSVNCLNNKHDQFPYATAEGCPNGVRQFSPGWGLKCAPVQNRIDNLNTVHSKAQARMGNILIVDDTKCDVSNLLSPDKNGLMIMRRKEGSGQPQEDLVGQIPLKDVTAGYNDEMEMWIKFLEDMTGANSYVQGQTEDPDQTLGQFDATKVMATGRVASIARMLAEQGIMPQTQRFVSNLQQFLPEVQEIRIMGEGRDYDPANPRPRYKKIKKIDIQGHYDVVPHDGSLPGADAKVVAAAARTIEAYASNPMLAPVFNTEIPGAIDPFKVFRDLLKKSGLQVQKYAVSLQEAAKNAQAKLAEQGIHGQVPGAPAGPPAPPQVNGAMPAVTTPAPPMVPVGADRIPSAATLPPATPPMLNGRTS